MRRLFSLSSLLPVWLVLFPACSTTNTDHCGNREGNLTCSQQNESTPFCSICVADNNGCVAEATTDTCLATTAAASSTSNPATTTSASDTSTTVDPPTSTTASTTSGTSTTSPTTTTEPTTTGQTDTGTTSTPDTSTTGTTTTGDTSTGDTGTGDTGTTVDTLDTFGTTGTSTGDSSTGGTTMEGPFCGNNMVEGTEVCDGTDHDGEDCKSIVPGKWGGGMLKCNNTCESFNDTMCCIGVGMACNILDPKCCGGLQCNLGTCAVKP